MTVAAVILAAGHGTRMNSKLPKFLHPLAGRPLVEWSLQAVEGLSDLRPVVVVGYARERVRDLLGERADYCVQEELLGTGHALMQARELLYQRADQILVLYSDMPLLRPETLTKLTQLRSEPARQQRAPIVLTMLTVEREEAQGFGRVVRDERGAVRAIVEEADCTPEEAAIRELNPGVYSFDAHWLWDNLSGLTPSSSDEYYLTDMVGIAAEQGGRIETVAAPPDEVYGINDRSQLAVAGRNAAPAHQWGAYAGRCDACRSCVHIHRRLRGHRPGFGYLSGNPSARGDDHRRRLPYWAGLPHHR